MPDKKKPKLWLYIFMIVFLVISVWVFITLSSGKTTFFGRAAGSGKVDTGNSYVFASPVSARVGGDKIRITVFVLDGQGKGVVNQSVTIACSDQAVCQNGGVAFAPVQPTTDTLGQAIWEISANGVGKYVIQASTGSSSIPQTVTIDFR